MQVVLCRIGTLLVVAESFLIGAPQHYRECLLHQLRLNPTSILLTLMRKTASLHPKETGEIEQQATRFHWFSDRQCLTKTWLNAVAC